MDTVVFFHVKTYIKGKRYADQKKAGQMNGSVLKYREGYNNMFPESTPIHAGTGQSARRYFCRLPVL